MSKGYYAIDKSGNLRHYKYVKREKKNGKWVYYYDDDLGGGKAVATKPATKPGHSTASMKTKNATKDAPSDKDWKTGNKYVDKVKDFLGYDEAAKASKAAENYKNTASEYDRSQGYYNKNVKNNTEKSENVRKTFSEDVKSKQATHEKAGRDYVAAQTEYNKTPLAKIRNATGKVKEQIDKGMKAVQSWLDNLTKRFKKK